MMGFMLKKKRKRLNQMNAEQDRSTGKEELYKNKRGKRRIPRSEKNKRRKSINEMMQISASELQQLNRHTLVEYIPDQQCRHKKAVNDRETKANQDVEASPRKKKRRAMEAVSQLITQISNKDSIELKPVYSKVHNLRCKVPTDYTSQLYNADKITPKSKRYKTPAKPIYSLDDQTVTNTSAFMIAVSTLNHNIHGVFAREAIPMKGK